MGLGDLFKKKPLTPEQESQREERRSAYEQSFQAEALRQERLKGVREAKRKYSGGGSLLGSLGSIQRGASAFGKSYPGLTSSYFGSSYFGSTPRRHKHAKHRHAKASKHGKTITIRL